ncbi:MAG: hypothetical protein R3B72_42170 [Polyangiaceae bacterium]
MRRFHPHPPVAARHQCAPLGLVGQHYHHAARRAPRPEPSQRLGRRRRHAARRRHRGAAARDALTVRERRRVRRDTTVGLDGDIYELDQGFLAGRVVTIGYCALDDPLEPWPELDGKQLPIHPVDPEGNACRKRPPRRPEPPLPDDESSSVDFDPADALLDRAVGRPPRHREEDSE